MSRTVEVYTGAYASGKSEIAINRAIKLSKQDKITLVDLDTVEPAYTLRPIQKVIESHGFKVITQEDYFGLGETGNTITPIQMNCLSIEGDIVIDVGYGAGGLDILDVINGIENEDNLKIYIVINTSKFETSSVDNIIEYIEFSKGLNPRDWKKFSGIICNPHFSDETTKEDILKGLEITKQASEKLGIPIISLCVSKGLLPSFDGSELGDIPIWPLERYMPKALW